MVELILFDMDGLMFDTEAITCRAFLEVVAEMGYEPIRDQYIKTLGLNVDDICLLYKEYFGQDVDVREIFDAIGRRKYEIIHREGIPVKKGLMELLDALDQRGIKKAIASSADRASILENVSLAGIEDRFDYMLSSKDAGVKRGKPYPDIFLEVLKQMDIAPEAAIVLEDSNNGIQAALAGKIPVIAIPDLVPVYEELAGECLGVAEDLTEVIAYL